MVSAVACRSFLGLFSVKDRLEWDGATDLGSKDSETGVESSIGSSFLLLESAWQKAILHPHQASLIK